MPSYARATRKATPRGPVLRRGCGLQEAAIATISATVDRGAPGEAVLDEECRAHAEAYVGEDEILAGARARAAAAGIPVIGPGAGAALRLLAAVLDARSAVEVGTGTGVSGTWLLRGMRPDGILTSVDAEAEHHRLARETFNCAGVPANRARLITGRALDVLPRLTDGAYDLVFATGEATEYGDYLHEARRLLRAGGVVAFDDAFAGSRVPDPARRDPATAALRELGRVLVEDPEFTPALLPVGRGLLCAAKRPTR